MTHSFMTSVLQSYKEDNAKSKEAYHSCEPNNFNFMINVVDFDGDSIDFDIEACSYTHANELAESYCAGIGVDIYDMQIYLINN